MKPIRRANKPRSQQCVGSEIRFPKGWGQIPPQKQIFRPLTEKDMEGFSREEWEEILAQEGSAGFPADRGRRNSANRA